MAKSPFEDSPMLSVQHSSLMRLHAMRIGAVNVRNVSLANVVLAMLIGMCSLDSVGQVTRRGPKPPQWSDWSSVPGFFETAQAVCDARRAAINWHKPLVFHANPNASWKGTCDYQNSWGGWEPMAHPFHGQQCPAGYQMRNWVERIPIAQFTTVWDGYTSYGPDQYCEAVYPIIEVDNRNSRPKSCPYRNPIYPLLGVKRQDIDTGFMVGGRPLKLSYDSSVRVPMAPGGVLPSDPRPSGFGALWSSSFHRRVLRQGTSTKTGALVARGDGHVVGFSGSGSYIAEADTNDRLMTVTGGFRYIDASSWSEEIYDSEGRLLRITDAKGPDVLFSYSDGTTSTSIAPAPGYLITVRDQSGRTISFTYQLPSGADPATGGRVATISDGAGQTITIVNNALGNLSTINWPDGTSRQFLYELAAHPWALTGIIDERSVRYATFGYDTAGRAISTEHAGGVDRISVSYTTPPQVVVREVVDSNTIYRYHDWSSPEGTVITDELGTSIGLSAAGIRGKTYGVGSSQPAGSGCNASASATAYDANGNLSSSDDFNGGRVCHVSDLSRNLETTRVEGLANGVACSSVTSANSTLPAGSRKVSTQWHPDWRLPLRRTQPGSLTTYIYNGQPDPFSGNAVMSCAPATALLHSGKPIAVVCKQVDQATTDVDGSQGFSATLQSGVDSRTWQWTYNEHGQVLTERDSLNNQTTNVYYTTTTADYTKGDLQISTNAAGHVTSYPRYNKHGQVLQKIDPNGVVSDYTYDLRRRLKTVKTGSQITSYDYDAAGQLKKITQSDGSYVAYDYDDAHRLIAVSDSSGNRIDYTLDNAGNRTAENVKDPSGALKRQLARAMDALGRVQQTTGRE